LAKLDLYRQCLLGPQYRQCWRPGGQHQHSSLLELEPTSDRIQRVLNFAREHLSDPLSVEHLAEVAHLSPRQFSRAFVAATGIPPAKAIERLRVDALKARRNLAAEQLATRTTAAVGTNRPLRRHMRASAELGPQTERPGLAGRTKRAGSGLPPSLVLT
jgi:transcriptional regulator GlxA family with amidase domain